MSKCCDMGEIVGCGVASQLDQRQVRQGCELGQCVLLKRLDDDRNRGFTVSNLAETVLIEHCEQFLSHVNAHLTLVVGVLFDLNVEASLDVFVQDAWYARLDIVEIVDCLLQSEHFKQAIKPLGAIGEPLLASEGLHFFQSEVIEEVVIRIVVIAGLHRLCLHPVSVYVTVVLHIGRLFEAWVVIGYQEAIGRHLYV